MPVIETDRLILRKLSLGDAAFILGLLNQPSFLHFIGDRGVRTIADAENYILQGPIDGYARFGFGLYLTELKDTHTPIGFCGLIKRDILNDIDIGYAFLPQFWSQGYATEAASAVLGYGREVLKLERIIAIVSPDNERSIHVLEKIGLRFERMMRWPDDASALKVYASAGHQPLITIRQVTAHEESLIAGLCQLLTDAVHNGASVGFLAPLVPETAANYWSKVFASLGANLYLWVAEAHGTVVGSVQLAAVDKENGRHRAEIQKLFVLKAYRGQGIASRLMGDAEAFARNIGRTLLVLDTLAGSDAEPIYRHLGWQRAGEIPDYAASPDGQLHATVYYYKHIAP